MLDNSSEIIISTKFLVGKSLMCDIWRRETAELMTQAMVFFFFCQCSLLWLSISQCGCVGMWARAAEVESELIKQNQGNRKE